MAPQPTFSILIATKNRLDDLKVTLSQISQLIERTDTECIICDDGSTDGTFEFIATTYPQILLIRHQQSRGYLFSRNEMLRKTKAEFAISLDDDANFLTDSPLEKVFAHFTGNPKCGLIAFRIFWGRELPENFSDDSIPKRVKGFVGCGHAWRMDSWKKIREYPEWFKFYGEETFASLELLARGIEVHFLPSILIHHRVDMKARRQGSDFAVRYRRSLRADFYIFNLFFPLHIVVKKMFYVLWKQFTTKVLKGNFSVVRPVFAALYDLMLNMPNILKHRRTLNSEQLKVFNHLPDTPIFWKSKTTRDGQ